MLVKSIVLGFCTLVTSSAFASLRSEIRGQSFICANDAGSYHLDFDGDAGRVDQQFGSRPVRKVQVIWHASGVAEIPTEDDLSEPALFERRNGTLIYDGVPCRRR